MPRSYRRAYNSNAVKRVVDGIKFDSQAEAQYWKTLRLMEQSGQITELEPSTANPKKPKFELQPAFMLLGKRQRAITYEADMRYVEDGIIVIVDVKAMRTTPKQRKRKPVRDEFNRTRRLFECKYLEELNSGAWRFDVIDAREVW